MPQTVNVIGYGPVTFPDGMSKEEMAAALRKLPPIPQAAIEAEPQGPSMTEQLGRQMGLATRPMAQAVMSAGGMLPLVVDPAVNFFNLAAGTNVPTMSQAMPRTLTAMGFPEPATATERVVQDMSTAGYGVAGAANLAKQALPAVTSLTAQEFLKMLATNPQAQAAAATAATAAGGALREGGAGPTAQIGGAMLAGMVAPGSGTGRALLQRPVVAPVSSLVQPFTQEGRQVIAGNVLRKVATEPDLAASRLAQAEPLVPGVQPTTAATAFDPGLAGLETSLRSATFDPSNLFGARLSANQQALLDAYRRISGKPGSVAAAEKKRKEITKPMREEAFAGVTVDPVTFQSGVNLVVNKAIDNVMASPTGVRMDVESAMKWATERVAKAKTPMALYEVRKDLAGAVQGKYNQENPSLRLAGGQLKDVIKAVDDVIDASAPGFKAYMDKYSKMSGPIDQMRMLQKIESQVTTGQPNLMTGEPVLAAGSLRRQLASKAEELDMKLSIPAQTRLDNIIDEINRGMASTAPGVRAPGSNTFQNMSMGNLIGRVFSESMADNTTLRTMTRPLDWLYKLPDQQVQQLLVESMLDPKLASVLISKANMMKVEPLAKSLRQKAQQLGLSTAVGGAQAFDDVPPELRFPLD